MRHIERDLSIRRMRNQRKYSLLIISVMLLACILLQLSFQLTAGLEETLRQNRRDIYGEWGALLAETDAKTERVIRANPFIDQTGKTVIYGFLNGDPLEMRQLNIGTMDETARELGHLKLREGRFPEDENEIAMEYSTLGLLGYEDALGQEITLEIVPSAELFGDVKAVTCTYTLCGIVKDYQINWPVCTRNRFPTGLVTEAGAGKIGGALQSHLLIRAAEGKETVYQDLENSGRITGAIETNDSEGGEAKLPYGQVLRNIRILTGGAVICILLLMISHSLKFRRECWRFLDALGMKQGQMYRMILWEAAICAAIAVTAGSAAGMGLYLLTLPVFEEVFGKTIVWKLSWRAAGEGALYSVAVITVSYLLSGIRLAGLIRNGGIRKRSGKRRKAYAMSKFTPASAVLHGWRYAGVRKAFQILILASIFLVVVLGVKEVKGKKDELVEYKWYTGNGYTLCASGAEGQQGIRKTLVQALEQIQGVESVETYYTGSGFTVDLSACEDSSYWRGILKTEQRISEILGTEAVSMENIGIDVLGIDQWEDFERFQRNLSEGEVTREMVENGDFCVLSLPPLEKRELNTEDLGLPELKSGRLYLPNPVREQLRASFLTEHEIRTGDILQLTYHSESGEEVNRQMTVTAILRTAAEWDTRSPYPGTTGISLIVGSGFWSEFGISSAEEKYNEVKLSFSEDAEALDTEEHVQRKLRTAPTVTVLNHREDYRQMQQELNSFIGMYSVFVVFYLILAFVILSQMMEAERQEKKRSYDTLLALGMDEVFLRQMKRAEILLMLGCAAAADAVVLGCYVVMK